VRLVLCHGTFDLLHIGHMRFFEAARALGDILVVTLTADAFVNKGPGRPIYSEEERAYALSRLKGVDIVDISRGKTGVEMIRKYRPDVYAKGADYHVADKHGALDIERMAVEAHGGRLAILAEELDSSTELLGRVIKWAEKAA
jgi:rfaE bifunctional protein nucleotidyltransferase chain/domain